MLNMWGISAEEQKLFLKHMKKLEMKNTISK